MSEIDSAQHREVCCGNLPAFSLRPAVEADIPFLVALRRTTMRALIERHFSWDETAQRDRVLFRLDCAQVIVSEHRDIGLFKVVPEPGETHLSQIQLLPECQGRGIASTLIRRLQSAAAVTGLPITLHVLRSNRALALYGRLGFAVYQEDQHFLFLNWKPAPLPAPARLPHPS